MNTSTHSDNITAEHKTTLYVVATPIGNLSDISQRMRTVLGEVDRIAAEDTRMTGQLLSLLGISKPLLASHAHNEASAAEKIIAYLANGENLALVSDAGTPAVSDPGARVVREVAAAGYTVVPIPGPSSVLTAIAGSGLVEGPFYFHGFLPNKGQARELELKAVLKNSCPIILFEAPHRILALMQSLIEQDAATRPCCIGREMTKKFEHFYRGSVQEVFEQLSLDSNSERGELVVVLGALAPNIGGEALSQFDATKLLPLLLEHLPAKTSVKIAAELTGESRNGLYEKALQIKQAKDD